MVWGRLGGDEAEEKEIEIEKKKGEQGKNCNFGMILLVVSVLEGLGLSQGSLACLGSLCFAGPPQLVEVWF